ncbi:SWIM zinc finger family protein [Tengunoibacter tsumagoiensis]|uniref:SWIM-type domain-containing protein n=1 Tax=Tengunoibacter tsumagoiensis TaxID=2014871 RepID=A0A401ZZJ2_9CHLR|nr:SWIM zinc finger family protein [Tengunoibacter tsumagoiensis]GCE12287.1 hypothetical protein KTT_21460 [Tengunoibacter tsumagoiensis]
MNIQLTSEQVLAMAPDSSSASAGKKLSQHKHWQGLGQSPEALWGECQGSALYRVSVDLSSLVAQCSCPSRKFPCKHSLALLLLANTSPTLFGEASAPEWVTEWLARRAASNKRKEGKEPKEGQSSAPSTSQIKTAEKRLTQVNAGIEKLNLWLDDLVRNGLGSLETRPATFWEHQAAQMIDAQAPGLATRVRALSTLPNASPDWPHRLLTQIGRLALLTEAYQHLGELEAPLQDDIRMLIGWNLKEDEVLARGEHVTDEWLVLGQIVEESDRKRTQKTWLYGTTSQRSAVIFQFAIGGSTFTEFYPTGIRQQAELVYWPGAASQRALFVHRTGDVTPIQQALPGQACIEDFLTTVANSLAQNPWRDAALCLLTSVVPVYDTVQQRWFIRDQQARALPLLQQDHWYLLAISGGLPIDFVGEWNGEALRPLGLFADRIYHTLL